MYLQWKINSCIDYKVELMESYKKKDKENYKPLIIEKRVEK